MPLLLPALWMLEQEARGLLTRLARVKPFVLYEPMVPAANISPAAQAAIERYLATGRDELRARVHSYLEWLRGGEGRRSTPAQAQRRFTFLRLRFNVVLSQFDLFADVITQRSEHQTGVWLAGLDTLAEDALSLPGRHYHPPPMVCYLDRGTGAAIRRVRTRLPGGGENPVGVIRVPRERMVGGGIASSLIHEIGHQAAALLDLVNSLRPILKGMQSSRGNEGIAWRLWERWISEILSDFWSIARVGIGSTFGLIGVVSLPRVFVFRLNPDDPHPMPWIRVKLSCAIGQALFPHPQWARLAGLWEAFYPLVSLDRERQRLLAALQSTMPGFVTLLVNHRPRALRGKSLIEAMDVEQRQPARLAAYWRSWRVSPKQMRKAPPALVFAAIGQARADRQITPEEESVVLGDLLTYWALGKALDTSAAHATRTVVTA